MFWRDNWLEETPLLQLALQDIPLHISYPSVKNYWSKERGWKWEDVENLLPMQVLSKLNQLRVREGKGSKDDLCWSLTPNVLFLVKSAYAVAKRALRCSPSYRWSTIWKLKVPQRIKMFLWLVQHGRILTNLERYKRKFTTNPYYLCCPGEVEDLNHLLRCCIKTKAILGHI